MFQKLFKALLLPIFFVFALYPQDLSFGIKLIKNEKFNEAKKYFSSYLNSPDKSEAYFYLGQIAFLENELDSAKLYFSEGTRSNEKSDINYAGLAKVNLVQNKLTEMESNQATALKLSDDENPVVYSVLAEAYMHPKIKNYDKALELINKALTIDSEYEDGYIILGKIYLNKGDGSSAIKNFDKALQINNKDPEAMTLKAEIYALINNYDEAINLLNEAIKNDSTYSHAYNVLAEIYANKKDYSNASQYYEKYISASESTPEKLKRYASMLYINQEYEKAIKILESNYDNDTEKVSSTRILAYSYQRLNNLEESKKYFEKLFSLPSAEYLSSDYENYSDLLSSTGNDSLAVVYLWKIFETDSNRNDVLSKISMLSFKNKKWDEVIRALEKKKTLTSQDYFDISRAYIFKGDKIIDDLIQNFSSNLTINDEQLIKLRIALLYYQKDFRDSFGDQTKINSALDILVQSIESFIPSNQKNKWSSVKTMWVDSVHSKIGLEYSKADTNLSILITKAPNLPVAYLWKARVSTNFDPESESGLAKPFYEQFIQIVGTDIEKFKRELIEAYSYLGYYYYLQEDNAKSKNYWQEVLKLDPENQQAKEVVKLLK